VIVSGVESAVLKAAAGKLTLQGLVLDCLPVKVKALRSFETPGIGGPRTQRHFPDKV
jgi:hypothetical protein